MTQQRRKPNAVRALIDAITDRGQLKKMGVEQTGPAQLPAKDTGGTRKNGRHRKD
jgi:hypothetical protein